jgi:hypothetical protein
MTTCTCRPVKTWLKQHAIKVKFNNPKKLLNIRDYIEKGTGKICKASEEIKFILYNK